MVGGCDLRDLNKCRGRISLFSRAVGLLKPVTEIPPSNRLPNGISDAFSQQSQSGIAGAIAQLNLESAEPSPALQEYIRRQNWETGNMDYMGKDSFDNIWAKICQTVEGKDLEVLPGSQPPSQSPSTESQKPGEGVAQPTMPKAEEKVSVLPKTSDPEYIETLPSEPPIRSTEEDEIIFSKPEKGAPLLSNIKEEEDKAVAPPVVAQTTPVGPPAAQTTPVGPPAPQSTPVGPPAAQTTPAGPPVAAQTTPVGPSVAPSTPPGPPASQSAPVSPPAAPMAMPTAPQAESKAETPSQGTPAAEPKPKETPSTDKPQPNVETKTQQTPGNDSKVVPPTEQIKPQEVPAPEVKAEAKAPVVAEGPATEKAKGSEKTEQVEKVPVASGGPKPEESAMGTPAVPQPPASKPGDEPKTTKEVTPKTENVQAPSTDSEKKAEPVIAPQPTELPKNVEVVKPETKDKQGPGSANAENLSKDVAEGKKTMDKITTEPTATPPKEDSAKPGLQTPVKEEAGVPPEQRQVPPTPTITPPTPTTPTSMALMVIPKDSKSLVKLSDIIDPTKPVQEEEQQKVGPTAEPIPMPPVPEPESSEQKKTKSSPSQEPTDQPQKTTRSDSLKENGKQKKGVFSKILEIVGVAPKDKKEDEGDPSKSVFYDVENAKEAISSPENVAEVKETPKEDINKATPQEPVSVIPEQEKTKEPEKPIEESKTEEKGKPGKNKGKQKPARNQKSGDTKSQAPLPKQPEPAKQETPVVPASAPASAEPQKQDVVMPPSVEPVTKETVKSEIEDILGKAKSEAESRLQAADTEVAGKAEELINTMKLLVDDGKEPQKVEQPDVEELKVTSPEERQKHKGEAAKSKLSDQILKAIPPPRRKAISDAKSEAPSSTGAIPKTTSEEAPKEEQKPKEQKPAEGGKGGKSGKASSIPVPPPRNKPKPPQAAPSKGKGKK